MSLLDMNISDQDWDCVNQALSSQLTYSIVNQHSKPPYYCSCTQKTFNNRQNFQRHMKKHDVLVPFKTMKRKADELDSDLVTKDFTR